MAEVVGPGWKTKRHPNSTQDFLSESNAGRLTLKLSSTLKLKKHQTNFVVSQSCNLITKLILKKQNPVIAESRDC